MSRNFIVFTNNLFVKTGQTSQRPVNSRPVNSPPVKCPPVNSQQTLLQYGNSYHSGVYVFVSAQ